MGEDRISELPSFIIHHIMFYLSRKKVAQTSILSRKWNCFRKSFPILDFDETDFVEYDGAYDTLLQINKGDELRKFIRFVDVSLIQFYQREFRIQKFRLSVIGIKKASLLDRWIGLVLEKDLKELDLNIRTLWPPAYTLPQIIFSAESMTTLKLVGCKLEQPSGTMRLYSLKKLTLEKVSIDEDMVQKLTSECPLLEDLAFSHCWGLQHLCVFEAPKLKIMRFDFTNSHTKLERFVITVSSLQELTLIFSLRTERPQIIEIARCLHLRKLNFESVNLTDQEFHYFISKFPFLEDLHVIRCYSLKRINISSNRLKNLEFSCCTNLRAIDVDTPNLLSFTYKSNQIPTYSINAPCSWKVFLESHDIDARWYLDLKKFLSLSKQIKELIIWVKSYKILFDLDGLRESSSLLPCQVGNLNICISVEFSDYEALLKGILWICHPRTFSITLLPECREKFSQWVYEKLRNMGELKCCSYRHVKCWRHYLKYINITTLPLQKMRRNQEFDGCLG